MIEWRESLALGALILVPLLVAFAVWAERRRRHDLARVIEAGLQDVVVPDVDARRRTIRAGLLVAAAAALVVALAGPQWGFRWEEVRREGVDVVVALDTSRSMLATDVKPNRLERAKLALRDLLGELGGDRIALVAFAGTAFVQCPLTVDLGVFTESLGTVDTTLIPRGGTALEVAIDTALEAFEGRQGKHQAIILITDGEDHEGDPKAAAERAADRGVKVFTVGIGTADGELIPLEGGAYLKDRAGQVVKSRLDEETLQNVAVATGGVYVRASGTSLGLPELYRDYVATMERRELASTLERRWEQRYQWPLAIALLLLVVEPWLGDRRTRALGMLVGLGLAGWAMPARAWLGDGTPARQAAAAYAAGDFEASADGYNRALTDEPDSVPLHFNLGAAEYRREEWEKATAALEAALRDATESTVIARAAYNLGNAHFEAGDAVRGTEPQKALEAWAAALVAYRRAIGADPEMPDVKYNYEYVQRRAEELRKQLEEQQKEQEQEQQQQEQQDQQEQEDQNQDQQQQGQDERQQEQPQDEQQQEQPQEQPQQDEQAPEDQAPQPGAEQPQEPQPSGAAEAEPTEAGERDERMSPNEAAALLDAQRDEELDPREMQRARIAGELPPAKDW